ncbi:hypothetical protein DFA_08859 [Cavenderia fasciculata]|uniref:Uncharacterized protein n=1 Tax=Cavenderia fasciculata TaxID=261658 RepID=F4Q4R2_CACFS|nr:uncharacterized protein DFA_08859 [Cavenderia fasciculata]EGG17858.1 hypothetical protein DFA_08859 [Cavenderia fasciculata]|eukprot:XP_004356342.1 hypothetical protein DFA_08859 [Cavenderia fasciculata]
MKDEGEKKTIMFAETDQIIENNQNNNSSNSVGSGTVSAIQQQQHNYHSNHNGIVLNSSIESTQSSIDYLPKNDEVEIQTLMGRRKPSELDLTMGYGDEVIEISQSIDDGDMYDYDDYHQPGGVGITLQNIYHPHDARTEKKGKSHIINSPLLESINLNGNTQDDSDDDSDSDSDNQEEQTESLNEININISQQQQQHSSGSGSQKQKMKKKPYYFIEPYITLLVSNKAYRLLFLSSLISQLGDWFNELACLTLLAKYGASGIMVSAFLVLRECPPFFFSPITGVVSDTFDRRKIMIMADVFRCVLVLLFLLVRSQGSLWLFLVKKDQLITANATEQTSYSSMMLIGAAIGGLVSYKFGTTVNYIIDSMTYIGSLICVLLLVRVMNQQSQLNQQKEEETEEEEEEESETMISESEESQFEYYMSQTETEDDNIHKQRLHQQNQHQQHLQPNNNNNNNNPGNSKTTTTTTAIGRYFSMYKEGMIFLRNHHYIWLITFCKASGALVWAGADTVLIRFGQKVFTMGDDGSLSLGIILACGGLGIVLVPFVFARIIPDKPIYHNNILKFGFFMNCFGTLALGFSASIFPVFLFFNVIRSMSTCVLWLYSSSILQQLLPNKVRGRVFAFEFGMLILCSVCAKMTTGLLLDEAQMSPQNVTYVFGLVGVLVFMVWMTLLNKFTLVEKS